MTGRVTMLSDDIWRLVDVITGSEETLPYVLLL